MGAIWLRDLPDVLSAAGLRFKLVAGWETRARSSGGLDRLDGISVHHTAESPSMNGAASASYMALRSPVKPVAQLYVDRDPWVWVLAAGAANTSGKGGQWGRIAKDLANSRTIGIECGNNGVGEPWPPGQQDCILQLVAALYNAYGPRHGWAPSELDQRVFGHYEYTDANPETYGRKCDPTGPSRWTPVGNGRGCMGADRWFMQLFRNDVRPRLGVPPSPEEDDDVKPSIWRAEGDLAEWLVHGATRAWIPTTEDRAAAVFLGAVTQPDGSSFVLGKQHLGALGGIVGPMPPGHRDGAGRLI